jgi:MFS superfamily sulfate permease-like transporter
MSGAIPDRHDDPGSTRASQTEPLPIGSLVVYLRHDAKTCIASFIGVLTSATRATLDGVVDLIASEPSVVLDLSRVKVVDQGGADAVDVLVKSVRARGGHFRMAETSGPPSASLRP